MYTEIIKKGGNLHLDDPLLYAYDLTVKGSEFSGRKWYRIKAWCCLRCIKPEYTIQQRRSGFPKCH